MGVLAIYALVTNPLLLIAIGFLCGGFIAINKWGVFASLLEPPITVRTERMITAAPEPLQVGDRTVTCVRVIPDCLRCIDHLPQAKAPLYWSFCYWVIFCLHRYEGSSNVLLVCSVPLLWFAAPFATIFWIIGASAVLILGHAAMTEPGVESEYTQVAETV